MSVPTGNQPGQATNPRPADPASGDVVKVHVPCWQCGYDLYTVPLRGGCPECGEEVRVTQFGRMNYALAPAWVVRLRFGSSLLGTSAGLFLAAVALSFAGVCMGGGAEFGMVVCLSMAGIVGGGGGLGMWLLTAPAGTVEDRPVRLRRRVARLGGLLTVGLAAAAGTQAALAGDVGWHSLVGGASILAALVAAGAEIALLDWYIIALADRFADEKADHAAQGSLIAVCLAGGVGAVYVVGTLTRGYWLPVGSAAYSFLLALVLLAAIAMVFATTMHIAALGWLRTSVQAWGTRRTDPAWDKPRTNG